MIHFGTCICGQFAYLLCTRQSYRLRSAAERRLGLIIGMGSDCSFPGFFPLSPLSAQPLPMKEMVYPGSCACLRLGSRRSLSHLPNRRRLIHSATIHL